MARHDSEEAADERMQRAEELLAKRLARPEDAGDPLGALKGGIEPESGRTTVIAAAIAAVVGLLIVWQAEAIARGIQEFIAGSDAADSPVIVYTIIGWLLVGASIVVAVINWREHGVEFEIREKGLRYFDGRKRLELRWGEVRDVVIKETEHIHAKYGSQYRDREITIQTDDETIVIPGIMEAAFPVTDILSQQWAEVGAGYASRGDAASRGGKSRGSSKKERGVDLPRMVSQKLAAGMPAKEVMNWLQAKHGLPREVAERVLAKALERDAP